MSVSVDELKHAIKDVIREDRARESNRQVQPTESHVDHVCGCPDCFCGVIDKLKKTSEIQCSDCGMPLGPKEFASKISNCPMCGGTEAKEVEREE